MYYFKSLNKFEKRKLDQVQATVKEELLVQPNTKPRSFKISRYSIESSEDMEEVRDKICEEGSQVTRLWVYKVHFKLKKAEFIHSLLELHAPVITELVIDECRCDNTSLSCMVKSGTRLKRLSFEESYITE
jgi:hypothetical protein